MTGSRWVRRSVVAALAALFLAGCGESRNPAREAIDAAAAGAEAEAARAETVGGGAADDAASWTCPMHPEVHVMEAGPCPKCAMPLVKEER